MSDFIELIQIYAENGGTKLLLRKSLILAVWYDIAHNATAIKLYGDKIIYVEDEYEDVRGALCGKED